MPTFFFLNDGRINRQNRNFPRRLIWTGSLVIFLLLILFMEDQHGVASKAWSLAVQRKADVDISFEEAWRTFRSGTEGINPVSSVQSETEDSAVVVAEEEEEIDMKEDGGSDERIESGSKPLGVKEDFEAKEKEGENSNLSKPEEVSTDTDTLRKPSIKVPLCKRTFQLNFGRYHHGFGSNFGMVARAYAVAKAHDYVFLAESNEWNYGTWEDYFDLPNTHNCRPPPRGSKRYDIKKSTGNGLSIELDFPDAAVPEWVTHNHVSAKTGSNTPAEREFMRLFLTESGLDDLHQNDIETAQTKAGRKSLTAEETVPTAFHRSFIAFADATRHLWRPNLALKMLSLEHEAKLNKIVAHTLNGPKEASDVVVVVHVRRGDKWREMDKFGEEGDRPGDISPELLHRYLGLAVSTVNKVLLDERRTSGSKVEKETPPPPEWRGRPNLLIMSDDLSVWKSFQQHSIGKRFIVRSTTAELIVSASDSKPIFHKVVRKASLKHRLPLEERSNLVGDDAETLASQLLHNRQGDFDLASSTIEKSKEGFNESIFNELPLLDRIKLTRIFLRDITVLTKVADGLVVTGSSNVGRLMMVLMGEEKVIRLGRARSLDTRWFPTSHSI